MSTSLSDALDALLVAARTVPGVWVGKGDATGTMRTPAVVVSLPRVRWEAYCTDPTSAQFTVSVVVSLDEYAMDKLLDLLPLVHAAVETHTHATVAEATPTPFNSPFGGSAGLVGFELTTDFPL